MPKIIDTSCVSDVKTLISQMPEAYQMRIRIVATILRDLLEKDKDSGESMLAFTLVMAEIADG